jgi:hypothetical protein
MSKQNYVQAGNFCWRMIGLARDGIRWWMKWKKKDLSELTVDLEKSKAAAGQGLGAYHRLKAY